MNRYLRISLFCMLCLLPTIAFSQEKDAKFRYSIGAGTSFDVNPNVKLWGLNIGGELNYQFAKRFSLNSGVSFYQSLGSLEKIEILGFPNVDNSSGIFISPTLRYDIIQKDSGFKLSLGAGPSLQLGSETFRRLNPGDPSNRIPVTVSNKYQRVGILLEAEAEWKTKNRNITNAFAISGYGAAYIFPWYLNATYKLRFQTGKK